MNFRSISNNLKLKRWVRYLIENPSFQLKHETKKLKINTPFELSNDSEKAYGVDYLIKISEDDTYLVPGEVLNEQYEIELSYISNREI